MDVQVERGNREEMLDQCLAAFVAEGTLDVSLDRLAGVVGVSKRMLIHYFGGKEAIEELATLRLEERLRRQFRADAFPAGTSLLQAMRMLWEQSTRTEARGVLLLVMDLNRRAWSGSERARGFYVEQRRLWVELLLGFTHDRKLVESALVLFQGAIMGYLVDGNAEFGWGVLESFLDTRLRDL